MLNQLFGGAVEQLTRGLAYATSRHSLLTQNIANVETPGYQARDLVFDDFLKGPRLPAPGAAPDGLPQVGPDGRTPRLVLASDSARRPDGNDVQLDRQMARLAENTLYQHTLVQLLANQFNTMKQAISGRI
jgi:flagellar basal-body rod protein FlgB